MTKEDSNWVNQKVKLIKNFKVVVWNTSNTGWTPLPWGQITKNSLISPCDLLLLPSRSEAGLDGWSVLTLEGGHKCFHYTRSSTSPLSVSCQHRGEAGIEWAVEAFETREGKHVGNWETSAGCHARGFPAPWSHNNLDRTRWVSNLWGLLKKTWIPQSYHPGAIGVFNPIFSSSIACYHITFQSQSEEMMNGGLCG